MYKYTYMFMRARVSVKNKQARNFLLKNIQFEFQMQLESVLKCATNPFTGHLEVILSA